MHQLIRKIAILPLKNIIRIRESARFFIVMILVSIRLIFQFSIVSADVERLLFISGILIFIIYLKFLKIIDKSIQRILLEQINLTKYIEYFELHQKSFFNKKKNKLALNMAQMGVDFFKGDFIKSLLLIEQLKNFKVSKKKTALSLYLVWYSFINKVYLGQDYDIGELIAQASVVKVKKKELSYKENLIKKMQAIHEIMTLQKTNHYFEHRKPENKLNELYAMYYRALNAQLKLDKEKATQLFQLLSVENEELFIVQQAKKWLKEQEK